MKVILQPSRVEEAQAMLDAMDVNSLQNFQAFAGKSEKPTHEKQQKLLEELIRDPRARLWSIYFEDKVIGTVGLREIDWRNRNGRLSVMLLADRYRGLGLGTDAMRQVLDLAFADPGLALHKVYLVVFAENNASNAKYAHLGFQFEARLQEEYLLGDERHDMVRMRVFAREWTVRKK